MTLRPHTNPVIIHATLVGGLCDAAIKQTTASRTVISRILHIQAADTTPPAIRFQPYASRVLLFLLADSVPNLLKVDKLEKRLCAVCGFKPLCKCNCVIRTFGLKLVAISREIWYNMTQLFYTNEKRGISVSTADPRTSHNVEFLGVTS